MSFPSNASPTTEYQFASRGKFAPHASVAVAPRSIDPSIREQAEVLGEAHEHFRHVCEYESEERRRWVQELEFVDELKHWTPEQKSERRGLPCMTFDLIGPKVDLVVNNMRQNPPEARVSPVGNGADKPTAEMIQGLLRNIDQDSGAEIAWMTGYEHAVKVGRGWVRAFYEYESDDSFEMKLIVKRISNLFSVYPDPGAEEYDYSDMRRCMVTERLPRSEFERKYPWASSSPLSTFEGASGDRFREDWYPHGQVRVAEYWWVVTEVEKIFKLNDGRVVTFADLKERDHVIAEREQSRRVVRQAMVTGSDVLSITDWPGKYIPIVPILGREFIGEDGRRQLRGMVRAAMDPNLSYDYMRSRQAQAIGLAPIAPWLVAEGQIENHKVQWDQANRKPWPYLTYKNEVDGKVVGPPIRTNSEVNIAGITQAVAQAAEDVKETTNTYAADLGAQGPESSGRAILAKQRASDNAHFHYADNLARSVRHMGRVLVDLIPHIYSEARSIAITDPDGSVRQLLANQPTMHEGAARIFNLADGAARYDVTIGTGPSYASRREQGKSALMEILPALPVIAARAPDLVIKALDIPDSEGFADRVRPPDVQAHADGQQMPPAAAAQIQKLMGLVQALSGKLDETTKEVKQKSLEWGARKEIAALQAQADILRSEISAKSAEMQTLAKLEHAGVKHRLDLEAAEGQRQQELQQAQSEAPGDPQKGATRAQASPDGSQSPESGPPSPGPNSPQAPQAPAPAEASPASRPAVPGAILGASRSAQLSIPGVG